LEAFFYPREIEDRLFLAHVRVDKKLHLKNLLVLKKF
jgi:hypothetical protein